MKKLLVMIALVSAASVQAATICQPDKSGTYCCWDTDIYGPMRPPFCTPY